jgi:hypothetical protein
VRVESVEEWRRETEQGQVKYAIAQIEVAIERQVARKADEQESARGARAAIQQHFDRMREAVAQRERALEAEVDEWERNMADAAAKRRVELAEAQVRLASAGEALQQELAQSATLRESWAARRAARAARAEVAASSITFVSEDPRIWVKVAGSSGLVKVEPPMPAADRNSGKVHLSSCEQS